MECEDCEVLFEEKELVKITDPFTGAVLETICKDCNERRYDNYIESFYG